MTRQERIKAAVVEGLSTTAKPELAKKAVAAHVLRAVPDALQTEINNAVEELSEASERDLSILRTVARIGGRYNTRDNENVGELIHRAAAAGDEEAKALLADRDRA